jgi:SAM-dependent methyltransferase
MARKGASVIGIDFADEIVRSAEEQEGLDGLGIDYHVCDAASLDMFEDASFDIVACFMAIMDIERYREAISEVSRVLGPQGRFIFNMPHPCFEIRVRDGEFVGGWEPSEGLDVDGPDSSSFYRVDSYFDTDEPEVIPWRMMRLTEPFETIAFHRTLTQYSGALVNAGLLISRIIEPIPSVNGVEALPILRGCLRIPHSIAFETVKVL